MGGKAPQAPDYEEAARQGVLAGVENYPAQYLTDAAAQMGTKVTIDGKTYDFTGLGDADNAAKMSDQMAQTLLDIQQNYGPQYIQQRLQELQQADPKGYAMRQDLFDRILADSKANPNRPLAADLQNSIMGELQNAGRLDSRELSEVQQQVRGKQVANNNYLGTAATGEEAAATVKASENLRDQQQQQAEGFLQSGVTPEDVQYRRIQQSLANLGAFQTGTTPEAEFRSVSAAGNTAAPFVGGTGTMPTLNPNAGQQGANNALGIYSGSVNWYGSQTNPYVAGLSTGISALNAGVAMGYRPTTGTGTQPITGYDTEQLY